MLNKTKGQWDTTGSGTHATKPSVGWNTAEWTSITLWCINTWIWTDNTLLKCQRKIQYTCLGNINNASQALRVKKEGGGGVINMKHMNYIDKVQPGWHPSSARELRVKQQTCVLHHRCPLLDLQVTCLHTFREGKIYSGGVLSSLLDYLSH